MKQAWKLVVGGMCGLLVAAGVAGCASDQGATATIEGRFIGRQIEYDFAKRLIAENEKNSPVLRDLRLLDHAASHTAGGLLEVQLRVQNVSADTLTVEYCFEWLDARRMPVPTPISRYLIRLMKPGEATFLSGIAPHPSATDFCIKVRRHVAQ